MGIEELLDLTRIDILAAANNHVFQPPDDVDVAIVIHRGQIAGMHPAGGVDRFGGRLRIAPVAQHHRVAARE